MDMFDFPYHRLQIAFQDSSNRTQFGNNYTFTAKPNAPVQRVFSLTFPALKWFVNPDGGINRSVEEKINLGRLEQFYLEHQTWKSFEYAGPDNVTFTVKFNKPLEIPQGTPGGAGVVENIQIELIEQP